MSPLTKVAAAVATAVLGSTAIATPAAASTLTVDARCWAVFGFNSPWWDFACTASAAGGTGGYQYTWQSLKPFTVFEDDRGPESEGYCAAYEDTRVQVTVTSGAETASTDITFYCGYGGAG